MNGFDKKLVAEAKAGFAVHLWRIVAIICFGGTLVMGYFLYSIQRDNQEVIVLQVTDMDTSGVVPYTILRDHALHDATYRKFLADFITKLREVSIDPEIVRNNVLTVFSFLQGVGDQQVKDSYRAHNVYDLSKTGMRIVPEVTAVHQRADNTDVWVVRWRELKYDTAGKFIGEQSYQGEVLVKYIKPQTIEQINNNPLGLWIYNFVFDEINETEVDKLN